MEGCDGGEERDSQVQRVPAAGWENLEGKGSQRVRELRGFLGNCLVDDEGRELREG